MTVLSRGSVAAMSLPELYWRIHHGRLTGCLKLVQEPNHKELFFIEGNPIFAKSTMKSEALGRRLLAQKLIDEDTYERATLNAIQSGQKLGEALVGQGALTREQLDDVLRAQIRQRFMAAFTLHRADFEFSEDFPAHLRDEKGTLDVLELLRSGIEKYFDFEGLTVKLKGWSERPIIRSRAYANVMLSAELRPDEMEVLGAIDGRRRIQDLMTELGMDPHRLLPMLYLFRCMGLLRGEADPEPSLSLPAVASQADALDQKLFELSGTRPAPRKEPPPRPAPPPPAAPVPESSEPPAAPPATPALPEPSPPSPPQETAPSASAPELQFEETVASSDAVGSDSADAAGMILDEFRDPMLPLPPPNTPEEKAPEAPKSFGFIRHDEEVEVDADLASAAPMEVPQVPMAGSTGAPASGPRMVDGIIEASRAYERGEKALILGDLEEALSQYEKALSINPGEAEYLCGHGWAVYVAARLAGQDPTRLAKALELAEKAIKGGGKLARAHQLRAVCLRDLGRAEEAQQSGARAAKLDPAAEYLEDELLSSYVGSSKKGGLMGRAGKLFGRGKKAKPSPGPKKADDDEITQL